MFGFRNVMIYKEGEGIVRGSIQIENGKFSSFNDDDSLQTLPEGMIIVPGFIDEHIHGANGSDAMDGTKEALDNIASSLPKDGVTSFLATTMTMSEDKIEKSLKNIACFMKTQSRGAKVLGIHLEGPFISKKYHGAQNVEDIKPLSKDLMDKLYKASEKNIKIVTFAYENDGDELLKYLLDNSIVPSIGHSDCPSSLASLGIERGIKCATHTFNAMRGIHHRDIGTVGEVLIDSRVNCELICDLHHVSPDAIKLLFMLKGNEKVILITDSMEARFLENGKYSLGGQDVYVKDGVARLIDGTLAGSTLRLNQALKNFKDVTGCTLEQVIDMVSKNPAKNLNVFDSKGSISIGKDADFVIIDKEFNVYKTFVGGVLEYDKQEK